MQALTITLDTALHAISNIIFDSTIDDLECLRQIADILECCKYLLF